VFDLGLCPQVLLSHSAALQDFTSSHSSLLRLTINVEVACTTNGHPVEDSHAISLSFWSGEECIFTSRSTLVLTTSAFKLLSGVAMLLREPITNDTRHLEKMRDNKDKYRMARLIHILRLIRIDKGVGRYW
jgi:hypothetical protein